MNYPTVREQIADKAREANETLRAIYLYLRDEIKPIPDDWERAHAIDGLRKFLGWVPGYIESIRPDRFPNSQRLESLGIQYFDPEAKELITDAPQAYDKFGTRQLEVLPYKPKGKSGRFRRVLVPPMALANDYQVNMYWSGNYTVIEPSELDSSIPLWQKIPQIYILMSLGSETHRAEGDSLEDAIEGFKSSVWEQGAGADERVMQQYGDYKIYETAYGVEDLIYKGLVKDVNPCP